MALHDLRYRHWRGQHEGIWHRRLVIARHGIRTCLTNRWMRYVLGTCWSLGFAVMATVFVIGQLLVKDSLIVQWSKTLRGGAEAFVAGFAQWLAEHPEVSVRVAENLLFYSYTSVAITLNFIVVMLAIPHLITRDLSSRALVVYASKAVTRWDYLIGKFLTLLSLLTLSWLGPACAAWFLGNLLAPEWHFFWHGRAAFVHTLLFTVGASLFLSLLGLGVSALSAKEKNAVGLWLILWLLGNALVPISQNTSPWLQYLSFRQDLRQLAIQTFQPAQDLERAQRQVPIVGEVLRQTAHRRPEDWRHPKVRPALIGLGFMAAGAAFLLHWRTRTE